MKTKITLLISILILSLFMIGCSPNQLEKYKEEIQKNPSFCNTFNNPQEKDACYTFAAYLRIDSDLCNKVISEKSKNECFEAVASKSTTPEECEKLSTQSSKERCYINVAKENKNISYCDKVVNAKLSCIDEVAVATNNESLCIYPGCIISVAIGKEDPAICKNMLNINITLLAEQEPDGILDEKSVKRTNLTEEENYCYRMCAAKLHIIELCLEENDEYFRNGCIVQIADNTSNISVCKYINIAEQPFVQECWTDDVGRHCTLEVHSYLNQTEDYKINNCYRIAKDDPKKCDEVIDDSMKLRNECYYSMSRINNNPELCKNIIIPGIEDMTCEKYLNKNNLIPTPER